MYDLRRTDDSPLLVPDGRDPKRNRDMSPVFCNMNGFIMVDTLPSLELVEDFCLLFLQVGGNQPKDGFADYFFTRVSENPRGSSVPTGNGSVQVLGDDGVIGRLDDCFQSESRFRK